MAEAFTPRAELKDESLHQAQGWIFRILEAAFIEIKHFFEKNILAKLVFIWLYYYYIDYCLALIAQLGPKTQFLVEILAQRFTVVSTHRKLFEGF